MGGRDLLLGNLIKHPGNIGCVLHENDKTIYR